MSIDVIAEDFSDGFDALREDTLGENAKVVLLQESGEELPYVELQTIEKGWYPKYSSYFGNTTFHVADITESTGNNIRNSSVLMVINSILEAMNNVIFEIKAETAPPDSSTPWWRIRAAATNKKYIPPQEV